MRDGLTTITRTEWACRFCGIAVPRDPERTWIAEGEYRRSASGDPVVCGLCDECEERMSSAEQIAPALKASAEEALAVLCAMSATGTEHASADPAAWDAASHYVREALAADGWPSAPTRLKFSASLSVDYSIAAASAWSWLSAQTVDRLRKALAAADAEREALAGMPELVRVEAPEGTACGVCGVSAVDYPSEASYRAGGPAAAAAEAFPIRHRRRVCIVCAAFDGDKATSAQRAALAAAGVLAEVEAARAEREALGERMPRIPTMVVWERRPSAKPCPKPWAFTDLEAFAKDVRAALAPKPEETPTLEELARRVARLEHRLTGWMEDAR